VAVGFQNQTDSQNLGSVVSVRGGVVDARFDHNLPPIFSVLHAGAEGKIIVEVMAQLDSTRVRGIALTPTEGLARGMRVEDSGKPLEVPVGKEIMSRMFRRIWICHRSQTAATECPMADHPSEAPARCPSVRQKSEIFETGIKAIDVACAAGARGQSWIVRWRGCGARQCFSPR